MNTTGGRAVGPSAMTRARIRDAARDIYLSAGRAYADAVRTNSPERRDLEEDLLRAALRYDKAMQQLEGSSPRRNAV